MRVRGGGAAKLFGRNYETQRVKAETRAAGDDEIASVEKRFVTLPCGNFEKLICAHDEVEMILRMFAAEAADGVDRVKDVAGAFERRFRDGRDEMGVVRTSEGDHCVAMQKCREVALGFVRRARRRDEVNRI